MIRAAPRPVGPDTARLESYLSSLLKADVRVTSVEPLGGFREGEAKQYGYGVPLSLRFEADGRPRRAVLETVKPGPFGHEHVSDRAQAMLWAHEAFNRLPRHAASIDVGAFRKDGSLVSLGDAGEFFVLMDFVEGTEYAEDLKRVAGKREPSSLDTARSDALCDYLADIHRRKGGDPGLYVRRLRDLLGHGECIMGLTDSYPAGPGFITPGLLEGIERRCLAWRWVLKRRSRRLSQVHGDFHPWNILFREGTDFTVLDRSRGEWGEPADDVTCLTTNYLFSSFVRNGRLEGAFEKLFVRFWDRYIDRTGDREVLEVAAPFYAFRGLVVASPVWYPDIGEDVRRRILTFVERVLDSPRFEPEAVNRYCGG